MKIMCRNVVTKCCLSLAAALCLVVPVADFVWAQGVDAVLQEGGERVAEGQQVQQQIDSIADKTEDLLQQYRTVGKELDGLNVYNSLLQQQLDNQQQEIDALQESIGRVDLVERQITPLMVRMIDSLAEFVSLDTPFLLQERTGRVERLRNMMVRSDVSAAEKLRRVLEAFQIENEYGRTLEAYKGSLEVDGKQREVDFLRIGRIALLAQTVGGEHSLAWNNGQWQSLPPELYKRHIAQGLQIARKQIAPDLLWVPLAPPVEAGL